MAQYRNIMVKYGDARKRLWPTEFGWASSSSPFPGYEYALYNNEQQQGDYIVRAYQMMRDWGFVGVAFLWNLNYNVSQPSTELAAFGIMNRPAYEKLRAAQK
jgi:polysaccharide biosynthesis protein PslG